MIKYSTRTEGNKFFVKYDLTPKNITCGRGNYTATHIGGGTTGRYGIWEGIELIGVAIKVGESPWTDFGRNPTPEVWTDTNNTRFQVKARYRLHTMGYHWQCTNGSIPFFYYGNIGGDPNRYVNGHFTDGNASNPGSNLHSIHALVPKDWTLVASKWSMWAYKHAQATAHWPCDPGGYEQRNGNAEGANAGNGWISDTGYAQAWRKSCLFQFDKEYLKTDIISSGISVEALAPEVVVTPTKGNSGLVKVIYKGSSPGKFRLKAYCKDKTAVLDDFPISGVQGHNGSWTYTSDFDKLFGREYEGNDIVYEAWAKNSFDKISPSSGKKGGHRYNGRPTIPVGLYVSGKDDLIYNKITFSWNECTDPDGDFVVYDLWLKAINPNGTIIRDDYLTRGYNKGPNYDYDIGNHPDGTKYILKVRSSDSTIVSDWSKELAFSKGEKPTGLVRLISPVIENTTLYSDAPRFVFSGYDNKSAFIVICNGKQYDSSKDSEKFVLDEDKIMFKTDLSSENKIQIEGYLKNPYGNSEKSTTYSFLRATPVENIVEGEYTKATVYKEVQKQITDKSKAYDINIELSSINKDDYIKAEDFNSSLDVLIAINESINGIINNDKFNVELISTKVSTGDYIDDSLWEKLIIDIKNI